MRALLTLFLATLCPALLATDKADLTSTTALDGEYQVSMQVLSKCEGGLLLKSLGLNEFALKVDFSEGQADALLADPAMDAPGKVALIAYKYFKELTPDQLKAVSYLLDNPGSFSRIKIRLPAAGGFVGESYGSISTLDPILNNSDQGVFLEAVMAIADALALLPETDEILPTGEDMPVPLLVEDFMRSALKGNLGRLRDYVIYQSVLSGSEMLPNTFNVIANKLLRNSGSDELLELRAKSVWIKTAESLYEKYYEFRNALGPEGPLYEAVMRDAERGMYFVNMMRRLLPDFKPESWQHEHPSAKGAKQFHDEMVLYVESKGHPESRISVRRLREHLERTLRAAVTAQLPVAKKSTTTSVVSSQSSAAPVVESTSARVVLSAAELAQLRQAYGPRWSDSVPGQVAHGLGILLAKVGESRFDAARDSVFWQIDKLPSVELPVNAVKHPKGHYEIYVSTPGGGKITLRLAKLKQGYFLDSFIVPRN